MPDTGEWLGQVLEGRYQVIAKIGAGGMAHIYKALHLKLERDVVVKVPRAAMLEDPDFAGRFTREIRSLVRLRHPFIVPIVDVGEHQGVPFMVLGYLPGGSLRDRLQERPQTPEELRTWLEGVSSALDFCHEHNCLHRDVKPDNILFDDQGRPALSDFGIAKVVATSRQTRATVLTSAGQVAGTPQYMAPELVMGQKIDGRVDQYALAVTVFEALTGKVPISAPSNEAIYVAQVTTPPELLDAKFGALADVLARALAKDPKLRYTSCGDFASAVLVASEFIAGTPAARSTGNPERALVSKDEEFVSVKVVAPPSVTYAAVKSGRGSRRSDRSVPLEAEAESLPPRAASELKALLADRRAAETSAGSSPANTETPALQSTPASEIVTRSGRLTPQLPYNATRSERERSPESVVQKTIAKKANPKEAKAKDEQRVKALVLAGIAVGVLFLAFVLWGTGVFRVKTKDGILVVEVSEPNPDVYVDGEKVIVTWAKGGKKAEISIAPGTRKVQVKKDGFQVYGEEVTLEDGGRNVVVARLEPTPSPDKGNQTTTTPPDAELYSKKGLKKGTPLFEEDVAKKPPLLQTAAKVLYGPSSGSIRTAPGWGVRSQRASITVRDCLVEVTFLNPFDTAQANWYESLAFRWVPSSAPRQYRVGVRSEGEWFYGDVDGTRTKWTGGKLPAGLFATKNGQKNRLKLVINEKRAEFFVNGQFVQGFDVSKNVKPGDVHAEIQLNRGKIADVGFEDFLVTELPTLAQSVGSSNPPKGSPKHGAEQKEIVNSIGMKLVYIPPGKFLMGSPNSEVGRQDSEFQHAVEITKGFYMGTYEVTQGEYEKVMHSNPSWFAASGEGKDRVLGLDTRRWPVDLVSWDDAIQFCKKLGQLEGKVYDLPTEAEWEYTCRGGGRPYQVFDFGNSLSSQQANFNGNFPYGGAEKGQFLARPTQVGSYAANAFGFFDMHGSLWEWCKDWYKADYYSEGPPRDPQGPGTGTWRVVRGGSFYCGARICRSANRHSQPPGHRFDSGFRVVLRVR